MGTPPTPTLPLIWLLKPGQHPAEVLLWAQGKTLRIPLIPAPDPGSFPEGPARDAVAYLLSQREHLLSLWGSRPAAPEGFAGARALRVMPLAGRRWCFELAGGVAVACPAAFLPLLERTQMANPVALEEGRWWMWPDVPAAISVSELLWALAHGAAQAPSLVCGRVGAAPASSSGQPALAPVAEAAGSPPAVEAVSELNAVTAAHQPSVAESTQETLVPAEAPRAEAIADGASVNVPFGTATASEVVAPVPVAAPNPSPNGDVSMTQAVPVATMEEAAPIPMAVPVAATEEAAPIPMAVPVATTEEAAPIPVAVPVATTEEVAPIPMAVPVAAPSQASPVAVNPPDAAAPPPVAEATARGARRPAPPAAEGESKVDRRTRVQAGSVQGMILLNGEFIDQSEYGRLTEEHTKRREAGQTVALGQVALELGYVTPDQLRFVMTLSRRVSVKEDQPKPLALFLLEHNVIRPVPMNLAMEKAQESGKPLEQVLVELNLINEAALKTFVDIHQRFSSNRG
ncbi:MAG: hypothetical protein VKP62_03885 [Candidatus Sericytochromatia bacterium]|nr:hypothetical protein [Candidatus Sericytochromatia bacterium]